MTTSVKISEAAKDHLEELRAEIRLETGRSVTQQELLDHLVERGYESREAIVDSYRDEWDGLSEAEIDQWLSGTVSSGDPVSPADVDRIVYEQDHRQDVEEDT